MAITGSQPGLLTSITATPQAQTRITH